MRTLPPSDVPTGARTREDRGLADLSRTAGRSVRSNKRTSPPFEWDQQAVSVGREGGVRIHRHGETRKEGRPQITGVHPHACLSPPAAPSPLPVPGPLEPPDHDVSDGVLCAGVIGLQVPKAHIAVLSVPNASSGNVGWKATQDTGKGAVLCTPTSAPSDRRRTQISRCDWST